jgi:hypothetical protein
MKTTKDTLRKAIARGTYDEIILRTKGDLSAVGREELRFVRTSKKFLLTGESDSASVEGARHGPRKLKAHTTEKEIKKNGNGKKRTKPKGTNASKHGRRVDG